MKNLVAFVKRHFILAYPAALLLRIFHSFGPRPKMKRSNYDDYFDAKSFATLAAVSVYRRRRYHALKKIILDHGGGSVFDVALGDSTTLQFLQREIPSLGAVWGSDLSTHAVKRAEESGIHAFNLDLSKITAAHLQSVVGANQNIDWILATEILEHIPEPETTLLELARIARKGVLVSVPNTGYYPFRMELLLGGRFPRQWDLWPGEHLRFWSYSDFKWWLKELNLQGQPRVYFGLPIISRLWKNLFGDGILWHIQPLKQGSAE